MTSRLVSQSPLAVIMAAVTMAALLLVACDDADRRSADLTIAAGTAPEALAGANCPGLPKGPNCFCLHSAECGGGMVCGVDVEDEPGRCRPALDCQALFIRGLCGEGQACAPPAAPRLDAECLPTCREGFRWSRAQGRCAPDPSCRPDIANSRLRACRAINRTCVHWDGGAACGGCLEGHVAPDSVSPCEPRQGCDGLDCAAEGRECVDTRRGAVCGGCLPGFAIAGRACVERACGDVQERASMAAVCAHAGRTCVEGLCDACVEGFAPADPDAGALLAPCFPRDTCDELRCGDAHRICVVAEGADDSCGGCQPGFVELGQACQPDPALGCQQLEGQCAPGEICVADVVGVRCACQPDVRDACLASNRGCAGGECSGCLDGFVADPNGCRPPRGCDEVECEPGQICVPRHRADAECWRDDCPEGRDLVGDGCERCPSCDPNAPGNQGVVGVWREDTTAAGWCICQTAPGYFFSVAGDVGPQPCDGDGDGWIRESARAAMISEDPTLVANARCAPLTIDRIVLRTESGAEHVELLDRPLDLVESDRNDDDLVLRVAWDRAQLPHEAWGEAGGGIRASMLNRFTKLCDSPRADYNDNGVPDVAEHEGLPLAPGLRRTLAPFNRFAYFAELHQGGFEPAFEGSRIGAWVITERTRENVDGGVPLHYGPPGEPPNDHWRSCLRRRDATYDGPSPGMDFAGLVDDPEGFMNHHSQFRCLALEGADDERIEGWVINDCVALRAPEGARAPRFNCGVEESPVAGVWWGAATYQRYEPSPDHAGYVRGCVNGCAEHLAQNDPQGQCPFVPGGVTDCRDDVADHGRLVCTEVPCDQIDNDRDPTTDDAAMEGQGCNTGEPGQCSAGVWACANGHPTCVSQRAPSVEICDGIDNDCNGATDDELGWPVGAPCRPQGDANGDANVGACALGVMLCTEGEVSCVPVAAQAPSPEICDGIDNDCDGTIDEESALLGTQAGPSPLDLFGQSCSSPRPGLMGVCAQTAWRCEDGEAVCASVARAQAEGCGEAACTCPPGVPIDRDTPRECLCDGLDNDCDGQTDEGGACRRVWEIELEVIPDQVEAGGLPVLNMSALPEGGYWYGAGIPFDVWVNFEGVGSELLEATLGMRIRHPHSTYSGTTTRRVRTPGLIQHIYAQRGLELTYRDICDVSANGYADMDACAGGDAPDQLVVDGDLTGAEPNCADLLPDLSTDQYNPLDPEPVRAASRNRFCLEGMPGVDLFTDAAIVELDCWGIVSGAEINCCPRPGPGFDPGCTYNEYTQCGNQQTHCVARIRVELDMAPPSAGQCDGVDVREDCDGRDNDCDGLIDEADPDLADPRLFDDQGAPITCGPEDVIGACTRGTLQCSGGEVACTGAVEPEPETCNGIDDDCDGLVDDDATEACDSDCGPGVKGCAVDDPCEVPCESGCGIGWARCEEPAGEALPGVFGPHCHPFPAHNREGVCGQLHLVCDEQQVEWIALNGDIGVYEQIEATCDGVDNDCDGLTDAGENLDGCETYYRTSGNRTWASPGAESRCLCAPQPPFTASVELRLSQETCIEPGASARGWCVDNGFGRLATLDELRRFLFVEGWLPANLRRYLAVSVDGDDRCDEGVSVVSLFDPGRRPGDLKRCGDVRDDCDRAVLCVSRCGDGLVARGEACDDGNTVGGDGCDLGCQIDGAPPEITDASVLLDRAQARLMVLVSGQDPENDVTSIRLELLDAAGDPVPLAGAPSVVHPFDFISAANGRFDGFVEAWLDPMEVDLAAVASARLTAGDRYDLWGPPIDRAVGEPAQLDLGAPCGLAVAPGSCPINSVCHPGANGVPVCTPSRPAVVDRVSPVWSAETSTLTVLVEGRDADDDVVDVQLERSDDGAWSQVVDPAFAVRSANGAFRALADTGGRRPDRVRVRPIEALAGRGADPVEADVIDLPRELQRGDVCDLGWRLGTCGIGLGCDDADETSIGRCLPHAPPVIDMARVHVDRSTGTIGFEVRGSDADGDAAGLWNRDLIAGMGNGDLVETPLLAFESLGGDDFVMRGLIHRADLSPLVEGQVLVLRDETALESEPALLAFGPAPQSPDDTCDRWGVLWGCAPERACAVQPGADFGLCVEAPNACPVPWEGIGLGGSLRARVTEDDPSRTEGTCGGRGPEAAFRFVADRTGGYDFTALTLQTRFLGETPPVFVYVRRYCGADHPALELACATPQGGGGGPRGPITVAEVNLLAGQEVWVVVDLANPLLNQLPRGVDATDIELRVRRR